MTTRFDGTRRGFLIGLLSSAATVAQAQSEQPRDRGIGGTGAAPDPEEGDRGIGGTGVIGTIRRFGSIIVNDLRITYPADVDVRIDGQRATAAALKIGHVVRTVATRRGGRLSTDRIEVASEVVGRIEQVGAGQITVLSQRIETKDAERWNPGQRVAVYGQRRPDGTIVASLIEVRDTGPARVAGPVRVLQDGSPTVGDLRLVDLDPSLANGRIVVEGSATDEGFSVQQARAETLDFRTQVRRFSIEAFVERQDGRVVVGSGLSLPSTVAASLPAGRSGLAVVSTRVDERGRARVEGVRVQSGESRRAPGEAPGRTAPGRERLPGAPGREGIGGGRGNDPRAGGNPVDRRGPVRDLGPEPPRGNASGGQSPSGLPGFGPSEDRPGGSPFGGSPFGGGPGSFGGGGSGGAGFGGGGFGGPGGGGGRR